jgi:hypothetical protein
MFYVLNSKNIPTIRAETKEDEKVIDDLKLLSTEEQSLKMQEIIKNIRRMSDVLCQKCGFRGAIEYYAPGFVCSCGENFAIVKVHINRK